MACPIYDVDCPLGLPMHVIDSKTHLPKYVLPTQPSPAGLHVHAQEAFKGKPIKILKDIPYNPANTENKYYKYDLYLPEIDLTPANGACCQPSPRKHDASDMSAPMLHSEGAGAHMLPPARPVVIFVPGGGWRQHGRFAPFGLNVGLARSLARRGYIVAMVSYRLRGAEFKNMLVLYLLMAAILSMIVTVPLVLTKGPTLPVLLGGLGAPILAIFFWHWLGWICNHSRVHHPGQLLDAAQAIAHIKNHIHEHHGDPTRLFLAGQSAGAHSAAMIALQPHLFEKFGLPGGICAANGFAGVLLLSPVCAPVSFLDTSVLSDDHERLRQRQCWAPLQNSVISFLYPAFQSHLKDSASFNKCFPLRVAFDLGNRGVEALGLPPFMILTTSGEFFIDTGTNKTALLLRNSGVPVYRYHILQADHGSYMFDMDLPGKPGEDVVAPLLGSFLIRCLTVHAKAPA